VHSRSNAPHPKRSDDSLSDLSSRRGCRCVSSLFCAIFSGCQRNPVARVTDTNYRTVSSRDLTVRISSGRNGAIADWGTVTTSTDSPRALKTSRIQPASPSSGAGTVSIKVAMSPCRRWYSGKSRFRETRLYSGISEFFIAWV